MVTRRSDGKLPVVGDRPQHSLGYLSRHNVMTAIATVLCAILAFAGVVAGATWIDLSSIISKSKIHVIAQDGDDFNGDLTDVKAGQAVNILIIGQDTRDGDENQEIGGGDWGGHRADTTMVMQISADRSYINLVSIPRDSIVSVPKCRTSDKTVPAQENIMFNQIFSNAYDYGGDLASAASCTMSAVNYLTDLHIHNFVVVDFEGLKSMIDAFGGVDVCVPYEIDDEYTQLKLEKGMQHLDGLQATQFARVRYVMGNGTDTMRTTRQQYFVKQLIRQALAKNLLTSSGQLYQLAKAALQSLNISAGLADTSTLAGLAMSLSGLNTNNLYMQTVPVVPYPLDENRRIWTDSADDLWKKLANEEPLISNDSSDSNDDSKDSSDTTDDTNSTDTTDTTDTTNTDSNSDDNTNSSDNDTSTDSNSDSDSDTKDSKETEHQTVDSMTGLIVLDDGTLIDPKTGGRVDPESGSIIDRETGDYIGISDEYLNYVVCGTYTIPGTTDDNSTDNN